MQTFFDLSLPITDLMPVYPGDEQPRLLMVNDLIQDGFNNFRLSATMHTGTHIDGPMHLTHSEKFLNEIPLEQAISLRQFGLGLGVVFQMIDDTLDFTANLDQLGKPTNHDFIQGKITLPLIHLRDRLELEERKRLISFADHPMTPADIEWLNRQLWQHNAVEYVRNYAQKLVQEANLNLALFTGSEYKTALLNLGECIIHREK